MTANPLTPVGDDFPEPHMEGPEQFDERLSGMEKGQVASAVVFGLCILGALGVLAVKGCSA